MMIVGVRAGLKKDRCESLIDEIRGKVEEDLYEYL